MLCCVSKQVVLHVLKDCSAFKTSGTNCPVKYNVTLQKACTFSNFTMNTSNVQSNFLLFFLGVQLTYNEPQIYSSNVPASLEENLPHLAAAARKKRVTAAPWYHQQQITSQGGQTFYSFAKAGKFNKGTEYCRLYFKY